MKAPATSKLRDGYTTGSCVAAGAVAAFRQLRYGERPESIALLLPGQTVLTIPVRLTGAGACTVVKDAGDDPDVTDGCEVEVRLAAAAGRRSEHDFLECCGGGTLFIGAGGGVGLVTRPGLAVPPGFWAINPGPRRIIVDNLARAGLDHGCWQLTVTVPAGEKLAARTLNPSLGITGGISILGNSGLVRPYSHAAYAATIALQLRTLGAAGGKHAALATGSRTAAALARDYPALPAAGVIRIGDFIRVALRAAAGAGLARVIVGCMPGKLFKYACGDANTHAHRSAMRLDRLPEFTSLLPPALDLGSLRSMGELAARLPFETYRRILADLAAAASRQLSRWSGPVKLEIALYGEEGERIS